MKTKIIFIYLLYILLNNNIICLEPSINSEDEEMIDLNDDEKPFPKPDDKDIFYIPIILTNDIHGSFYPKKVLLPSGETYSIGGLEYLGKYVSIMSEE